jgi:serine/threonine protein kinase
VAVKAFSSQDAAETELAIYNLLKGSKHLAEIRSREIHFEPDLDAWTISMELLGPSVEELFRRDMRQFSVSDIAKIGLQMVCPSDLNSAPLKPQQMEALRFVHEQGIVHMDVKPHNIMYGKSNGKVLRLVDYNLAQSYKTDGQHVPVAQHQRPMGTALFASTNTHQGYCERNLMIHCLRNSLIWLLPAGSRRDDMMSLSFTLLYLQYRGELPWCEDATLNDSSLLWDDVYRQKMVVINHKSWFQQDLYAPKIICQILWDSLASEFTTEPQYEYYIRELKDLADVCNVHEVLRTALVRQPFKEIRNILNSASPKALRRGER